MTTEDVQVPSYTDLMFPTLQALEALDGVATTHEIDDQVIAIAEITIDQLDVAYTDDAQQSGSKVKHRLAWARSYLKKLDAIENKGRGEWSLTDDGRSYLRFEDGDQRVRHKEHELRFGRRPELFLDEAKQRAADDPMALTVRDLLAKWDLGRRGSAVVDRIRRDLSDAGIESVPSFATVPLDSEVVLRAAFLAHSAPQPDHKPSEPEATTVTIGTLPSARGGVACVTKEDSLLKAQSLMESRDFSQLLVCSNLRQVDGAISWESIAREALYGNSAGNVRTATEQAVIVDESEPLLEHIETIADAGFVFVHDHTKQVVGIVTAADLSAEFAKLANPFLLLGEIEGWLRRLVDSKFEAEDLAGYVDPDDPDRQIEAAQNLTFGEYVRLLQDPDAWETLGVVADRAVFCTHLDEVRQVRNSIMHFSPDPLDPNDLAKIEHLLRWVRRLAND